MPRIQSVSDTTYEGTRGFIIEWEFIGFSENTARGRAKMMTAMSFPTTIATSRVIGVREFDPNDFNVQVFVPTKGLLSAGIQNPIEWVREEMGDVFME